MDSRGTDASSRHCVDARYYGCAFPLRTGFEHKHRGVVYRLVATVRLLRTLRVTRHTHALRTTTHTSSPPRTRTHCHTPHRTPLAHAHAHARARLTAAILRALVLCL